jgi:hypothetical protein
MTAWRSAQWTSLRRVTLSHSFHSEEGRILARQNYQYEKRQRDLAKKKKREEKRQRKLEKNADPEVAPEQTQEIDKMP